MGLIRRLARTASIASWTEFSSTLCATPRTLALDAGATIRALERSAAYTIAGWLG